MSAVGVRIRVPNDDVRDPLLEAARHELADLIAARRRSDLLRLLDDCLTPMPIGEFETGDGTVWQDDDGRISATFLLWDSADAPGYRMPFKAELALVNGMMWTVKSIVSQCASCFGSGVVENDHLCETCGGAGWGLISDAAATHEAIARR